MKKTWFRNSAYGTNRRERLTKTPFQGVVEKAPRCGKTTVIPAKAGIHFMIFAFVFAFDSDSREGASRPNPERMRWIYMAESVSFPAGSEDVRAKGQKQRRKWIPAFAGMTNKTTSPLVVTAPPRGCPHRSRPVPTANDLESRTRVFSTTPSRGGVILFSLVCWQCCS